jgi:hypothetical protein
MWELESAFQIMSPESIVLACGVGESISAGVISFTAWMAEFDRLKKLNAEIMGDSTGGKQTTKRNKRKAADEDD